jgi:hypothetical protein
MSNPYAFEAAITARLKSACPLAKDVLPVADLEDAQENSLVTPALYLSAGPTSITDHAGDKKQARGEQLWAVIAVIRSARQNHRDADRSTIGDLAGQAIAALSGFAPEGKSRSTLKIDRIDAPVYDQGFVLLSVQFSVPITLGNTA